MTVYCDEGIMTLLSLDHTEWTVVGNHNKANGAKGREKKQRENEMLSKPRMKHQCRCIAYELYSIQKIKYLKETLLALGCFGFYFHFLDLSLFFRVSLCFITR